MATVRGICGLCRKESDLQDSHLMPAAIYRWIRAANKGSPVIWSKDVAFFSDAQVKGYFLCAKCEGDLNDNGERWVLKNCYRGKDRFPLLGMLNAHTPLNTEVAATLYHADAATSGKAGKLAYFAASVSWRASARKWQVPNRKERDWGIDLGKTYTEELRLFLRGERGFPEHAVVVAHVLSTSKLAATMMFPHGGINPERSHGVYHFSIPGILFGLLLGRRMPEQLRRYCMHRAPNHPIWVSSTIEEAMVNGVARRSGGINPVGRLKVETLNRLPK